MDTDDTIFTVSVPLPSLAALAHDAPRRQSGAAGPAARKNRPQAASACRIMAASKFQDEDALEASPDPDELDQAVLCRAAAFHVDHEDRRSSRRELTKTFSQQPHRRRLVRCVRGRRAR